MKPALTNDRDRAEYLQCMQVAVEAFTEEELGEMGDNDAVASNVCAVADELFQRFMERCQ